MKQRLLSIPLALLLGASLAHAVKFNPEAMRTLQEQGNRMADQILTLHPYRLPSGKCLHQTGDLKTLPANVIIANCSGKASQNWKFDAKRRFLNQGGACLGVAGDPAKADVNVRAVPCGGGPALVWRPGADGRITHSSGKCLTVGGNPNVAGTNVILSPCRGEPRQKWR
jgi:hypothetical protein